jgi:endonuclease/exonuclease/phosphatase family metal-dependent hydrolase
VNAGQAIFSLFKPLSSQRIAFPGNYSWPKRLFMLDRCFILFRFELADNHQLVILNTHNSAFDDGTLRKQQLEELKEAALKEYAKGNYVLIGGDWNMNPPAYQPGDINTGDLAVKILPPVKTDLMPPDWKWAYDPSVPSNRFVDTAYIKGKTRVTIIDFFLLSPNIEVTSLNTLDLGFEFSDHNPVRLNFRLKKEK